MNTADTLAKFNDAAAFVRADLEQLDETDRAALGPLADLLEAAGGGMLDLADVGDYIEAIADGLLGIKASEDRAKRIGTENAAEHLVTVVGVNSYLYRWECKCGDVGIAAADKLTAQTGADRHVADKLTARITADQAAPVA